jgi:hypothetical protein
MRTGLEGRLRSSVELSLKDEDFGRRLIDVDTIHALVMTYPSHTLGGGVTIRDKESLHEPVDEGVIESPFGIGFMKFLNLAPKGINADWLLH